MLVNTGGLSVMDSNGAPPDGAERPLAGWNVYRCAWAPFAVAYPPGWRVDESPAFGRILFGPPGERDAITVNVIDVIQTETGGLDFEAVTAALARTLQRLITDYRETAVVRTADALRIDYSGELVLPSKGTLYFIRSGATVCALHFFCPLSAADRHAPVMEAMLASLRVGDGDGNGDSP